jgi:hypothetical protein
MDRDGVVGADPVKGDEYQLDSAKNLDRIFPGDFDTPVFQTEIHATFSPQMLGSSCVSS